MIGTIKGGSITSVPGIQASGVACGLKKGTALDLALIYSTAPCHAAALFTTNSFLAAPYSTTGESWPGIETTCERS